MCFIHADPGDNRIKVFLTAVQNFTKNISQKNDEVFAFPDRTLHYYMLEKVFKQK